MLSWLFAEFTVFGEICLLTSSSRRDALPVGRVCLVGSHGGGSYCLIACKDC